MNKKEMIRSAVIGLLALVGLIAWLKTRPPVPDQWKPAQAGQLLFPNFTDTAAVRTIRITRRGDSGDLERVELTRSSDGWRITGTGSAGGMTAEGTAGITDAPAENADRIASVLAPLMNLSILTAAGMESGTPEEKIAAYNRQCGLLDPAKAVGDESADAGILLEVGGENGEMFVQAVIGREPPESSAVRDLRYIRLADSDDAATVDFSAETAQTAEQEKVSRYVDRLSTCPIDWMNSDLLRISRWKIAEFFYFPYKANADESLTLTNQYTFKQDPDQALDRVWSATENRTFDAGKPVDAGLENLPVDSAWINSTADTLGRIHFCTMERKSDPLPELCRSKRPIQEWLPEKDLLAESGFYFADHNPLEPESADPYLCGEGGEVRLTMTDGAAYRILFGKKQEAGRKVMVICSLNESVFTASEGSERDLNRAEGEKKVQANARRFDDWFYVIPEADYESLLKR